jgi:Domain of unknown function (DUF222)
MHELENLESAAAELEASADLDFIDPSRLAVVVNRLSGVLGRVVHRATARGEHLLEGCSPSTWVAERCQISKSSAADRLCVGKQLEQLPRLAQALSSGEVGYQAASIVCHLQERIAEVGSRVDEEEWVGMARQWPLKALSAEAASTWHGLDPAGFNLKVEEAHERRQLFLSPCGDMLRVDGWLEVSTGVVLKTAIEALAAPLGSDDKRSPRQRRADAAVEMAQHVLDQGQLRRRHGVRPQIAVHTTLAGLKAELGAPASQLQDGTPISSQTVQRLACDGLLHRVLKADSMVVDVGRAKRTAQPAQWRGLQARHQTCAWTGCDRPIGWTNAHHIDFWAEGGQTNLEKMIPLCHHHHRQVHEGGWQVVQAGSRLEFIPPDRPALTRRRWGEGRWAA